MYLGQVLANSIVLGTQVLLVAVPLYLIYAVARIFHLALGATAAAVAYAAYFCISHGWPIGGTVLFALIVALLLGALSFRLLEPFARDMQSLYGLIVSFSLGVVIEALISIIFGTDGKSFTNSIVSTLHFAGIQITVPGVITIIGGVVFACFTAIVVRHTPSGRLVRSIAENPFAVESLALNQSRIRFFVFLISAVIAGGIGVLTGLHTALTPLMGFNLIIMAFIALLVGGVHDIRGTIVASYLISLIPELIISFSGGTYSISPTWKMFLVFVVAVLMLSVRPEGIFAAAKRKG